MGDPGQLPFFPGSKGRTGEKLTDIVTLNEDSKELREDI